ncbi:GNAT family N-acetyltransferase [Actinomadura rubrisoli]|uniref:GNAT family N-acetyltransferase n=1 Tax=Actinomadura rubrisoli TaxID=2530368 RepID=A0A4R5B3X7_9ACTN|nr:GNAT family N-acetyltransferase [Actinomadura rubrisoli]TDD77832.1 GNAT family N-acetyltransferase [Actinomadura rubrisoli]
MPELVRPTVSVHRSFVAAMEEFQREGRGRADDSTMIGMERREYGEGWNDPDVFAEYVQRLRAQVRESAPRPEGFVPSTSLWWVDGSEYLGRIVIRHRLTPTLLDMGGHIGYDVRPSARRQGHAGNMLSAALPVAYGLGIDPALITCEEGNAASRRVIEKNGGVLEDRRGTKLRYWAPTAR